MVLEIWEDIDGKVDILVVGVGIGGIVIGVVEIIKVRKFEFKAIVVEFFNSLVLFGGKLGLYKIQGIGVGFVLDVLDMKIIDEIIQVFDNDVIIYGCCIVKEEGILFGIFMGVVFYAVIEVGKCLENDGKLIVMIQFSFGECYLSILLF